MIYFKRYDIFIISVHRMIHNIITKSSKTDRYSKRRRKFSMRTGGTIRVFFFFLVQRKHASAMVLQVSMVSLGLPSKHSISNFHQMPCSVAQNICPRVPECSTVVQATWSPSWRSPLYKSIPPSPPVHVLTCIRTPPTHLGFSARRRSLVQPRVNSRQRSNFSRCYTTCVYIVVHTNFWTKRNEQGYEIKVLLAIGGYLQKFIIEKGDKF